jgi:hypothetical protein
LLDESGAGAVLAELADVQRIKRED